MKLKFSQRIFEKMLKCQISWKSVQREPSCSIRTDGQTDMTKLTVAFRKCAITLQNDGFSVKTLNDWLFKWKQIFFSLCELRIKFLKQK